MVQIVKSEVDFEKFTTNKKQTLRLKLIFLKLTNLSSLRNFNESIRENLMGAFINHVDMSGGGGVNQMSMLQHKLY